MSVSMTLYYPHPQLLPRRSGRLRLPTVSCLDHTLRQSRCERWKLNNSKHIYFIMLKWMTRHPPECEQGGLPPLHGAHSGDLAAADAAPVPAAGRRPRHAACLHLRPGGILPSRELTVIVLSNVDMISVQANIHNFRVVKPHIKLGHFLAKL